MACSLPHGQLTGTVKFYLAPVGTAVPAVNTTPASPWVWMGATDGEQEFQNDGELVLFRDNEHQGPVKAVRPEEEKRVMADLVDLTLENFARVLSSVDQITTDTSPNIKTLPFKQGACVTEYALLARGESDSPYGVYPAQEIIPRGAFEGGFTRTRSRDGRPAVSFEFVALEDDTVDDEKSLGWMEAQTS